MSILDKASLIQIPSGYKNGKLYSVKPNPTFGSELVTNGDFASDTWWQKSSSNVNISNGKGNFTAGTTEYFYKANILTIGKKYKLVYELTDFTTGYISAFGGNWTELQNQTGTYEIYFTCINDDFGLVGNTFIGSIDNVSVKEVTNIGDFTFARSSSATRVNSEGLIEVASVLGSELITNGDFNTDSDWTKGSGWTISGGKATKSGTDLAYLTQSSLTSVVGKTYRVKASITNVTTGNIRIDNFTSGTTYTSNVEIDITYTATSAGVFRFLGWGGFDGSVDNVSVKEVIENDVPRLDYSGGASCASLLLEGQSTNLVTYSESLSNSPIKSGTFTDNFATSPDGTQNATKITATSTDPFFYQSISFNASDYTASIYIKGIGDSIGKDFQIRLGANIYENTIPSEWTRFVYTATMTSITTNAGIEIPNPAVVGDEVLAWGWQLEESSYATSYIPSNSGSQTTRTADVCNNAGTSATFNDSEGVLFAEIAVSDFDNYRLISLSDGTSSNRIFVGTRITTGYIYYFVISGGSTQATHITTQLATDFTKIAVKYKANDFALWINGTEVAIDTSGSTPVGLSELAFDGGDGALDFYGKTKQLMTFNEALSDEELSDLTGQVNLSFNNLATFYGYTIL